MTSGPGAMSRAGCGTDGARSRVRRCSPFSQQSSTDQVAHALSIRAQQAARLAGLADHPWHNSTALVAANRTVNPMAVRRRSSPVRRVFRVPGKNAPLRNGRSTDLHAFMGARLSYSSSRARCRKGLIPPGPAWPFQLMAGRAQPQAKAAEAGSAIGCLGHEPGPPVWSFPAVAARADSTFAIFY